MTKNQLKNIIRECINESFINEGLPNGTSKLAMESALTLNNIIGKMSRPDLSREARVHAAEIIKLIDQDQTGTI